MSSLTQEQFQEAQPSGMMLFSLPPTQTAVEKIYYQEIRPISQISGDAPVEFLVSGQNGMEYMDLKRSKLYVKAKIIHGDGSKPLDTEYVGPVNLTLQSMFSQVDVTLQGKSVSSTTTHYPYKCMIETLLSYGDEAKSSQLTSQLFYKDSSGQLDDNDVTQGRNTALYDRAKYFTGGKSVDLEGPLMADVFNMERYILNQVAVGVRLYRSKGEFCLMTNELGPNFQIFIEDIILKVCKLQINPAVIYGHAEVMKTVPALYPYTRTEVKMMAIPSGQVNFTWDNMFQGIRPNKLIVGFVDSQAVAGSYEKNPFNFQHFDLNRICLYVDNIPVGGNALRLNFDANSGVTSIPAYTNMFETMGKWNADLGNQLHRNDVSQGYALFCFEIEPQFHGSKDYLTLLKQGNTRLEAQFSKALPNTTTCVVYSTFPALFSITGARDIILE
ncbi:hypothetical protein FSP39_014345 [Pinctada imbricata]|uniref:Uncharacterized protein n=1 Tax=Pinctada imbricata TaxID=66713 RepID=A0AA88YTS8_PINIB|nr:hypothetical protein FSP39_014345 [Pinctada imbricata]